MITRVRRIQPNAMHCTCRSLLSSTLLPTASRVPTLPPAFLLPAFSAVQTASFSSSTSQHARKDGNPSRGVSALRRTGLNRRQKLSVKLANLPKPVLDPERRSKVKVDEYHGLYDFLPSGRTSMSTPTELNAHGRGWTVPELRNKDWDDLHRLWWVCIKERNRIQTTLHEMQRIGSVYGDVESGDRDKEVRKTMNSIKHALTERWYAWENARVSAMEDEEVDLYADPDKGEQAYLPKQHTDEVRLPPHNRVEGKC